MKNSKALEEVWKLREEVAKELQSIPREKRAYYLNETAHKACKRLGIKCRTAAPRLKTDVK